MQLRVSDGLLIGALALSSISLFFAWVSRGRALEIGPSRIGIADLEAQANAFADELRRLQALVEEEELRQSVRVPVSTGVVAPDETWDELVERLENLERDLDAKLMAATPHAGPRDDSERRPLGDTREAVEAMQTYQAAFLDSHVDIATRLNLLRLLRRFPDDMAPMNAIIPEVQILLGSLEGRDLERLVDVIDGVDDPRLRDSLLELLGSEPEEEVQLEVVRALGQFRSEATVQFALQAVASGPDGLRSVKAARGVLELIDLERQGH